MSYEGFRDIVRGMSNKDLSNNTVNEPDFSSGVAKGAYIYERKLRLLYDKLF
jgi:hypothetical protein